MATLEQLNARGQGFLLGLIGIEFLSLEEVKDDVSGKMIALFRCTQLILYPR